MLTFDNPKTFEGIENLDLKDNSTPILNQIINKR